MAYHDGQAFSTKDQDNDDRAEPCAVIRHGAWWYKDCYESNLNGEYLGANSTAGVKWNYWSGSFSLKFTEMKLARN